VAEEAAEHPQVLAVGVAVEVGLLILLVVRVVEVECHHFVVVIRVIRVNFINNSLMGYIMVHRLVIFF
jgi:hypothetical protein